MNVLRYMASNGLVANALKTSFLVLNHKTENDEVLEIKIGNSIVKQEKEAKLLGMQFSDSQKWNTHLTGIGGVGSSLNQRFFIIRRLKRVINRKSLIKVADSIFNSKIRYGLQLCGKTRLNEDEAKDSSLVKIQKIQNKLVRCLEGVRLSDKKHTKDLLENVGFLSVNQCNAQIKLMEMWKIKNIPNYPIKIVTPNPNPESRQTRSETGGLIQENCRSKISRATFLNDSIHIWNIAPKIIKESSSKEMARKHIKQFVKSLPV